MPKQRGKKGFGIKYLLARAFSPFRAQDARQPPSKPRPDTPDTVRPAGTSALPRKVGALNEYFSLGRNFLFNLTLLVLSIALLILAGKEIASTPIIVHPIPVPAAVLNQGYTPDVLAARVVSQMRRINREAATLMPRPRILWQEEQADIQMPVQSISFKALIHYLKELLGIEEISVLIDVTGKDGEYIAQVSVQGGTYSGNQEAARSEPNEPMEEFIQKIAQSAMKASSPYIFATYKLTKANKADPSHSSEFTAACLILDDLIAKPPFHDDKWAYLAKGMACAMLGRYREAIQCNQRAIECDPAFPLPYINWGNMLQNIKEPEEAISKYQKAIELNPRLPLAYSNWGHALHELNRYAEAIDKYQTAIKLDPLSAFTYDGWGMVLQSIERHEEAAEKHEKAVQLDSTNARYYIDWGMALQATGQLRAAVDKFEKALDLDPNNAHAFFQWGLALYDGNHFREAIAKFQKAIKCDPSHALAYCYWGNALRALHQTKEALDKYLKASQLDPADGLIYLGWGDTLTLTGQQEAAIEAYQKAAFCFSFKLQVIF